MKFTWFHLMPYRFLPEDFKEKYRSVWVDIPRDLYDPKVGHRLYNDYLDQLEYADLMGFDGLGVNEHHQNAYGLMPSPNIMAAALTRRTRNANLVVLGNSIALYNPPTRVAEEFAMLDVISGGRLIAGFPVGTPMDDCYAYGTNPSQLRERYYEAHDLIMRAWQDRETFAFNGRYNQQRYVNIWPRPIQQPHPPIWIPGGGSVETWQWCAEMDYVYCYLSYYGHKAGQATMDGYWAEMDRLGKDRNPYRAAFAQTIAVAESPDQALELYTEAAEYFFGRCLHFDPRFAAPPGYSTEATQRSGLSSQVSAAALRTVARPTEMQDLVDAGYIVIGSPKQVTEQMIELSENLNVGNLMLLMQFGNMSKDLTRYNSKLFAEKVMPELKKFYSEWEHRWWPKPMDNSLRASIPAYAPAAE